MPENRYQVFIFCRKNALLRVSSRPMFIRKKSKKEKTTGRCYFMYQLVECVRTERGPRQQILLSIGPDLNLPEEQHKMLANRIEEITTGVHPLIPYPEEVERLAQEYAAQLINRLTEKAKPHAAPREEEYHSVDLRTIEQQEPRTVGAEHVLLTIAQQLCLPQQLRAWGLSQHETILALGTIIGRAIFPASELSTYQWLTQRSGLGELLNHQFRVNSLHQFYKISDTLLSLKPVMEKYLEQKEQQLHSFRNTLVLYDLTNTYLEGRASANEKAQFGRSKEKRTDCKLLTLGLVINEHGFAKRSEFLPGNISEPGSFRQAIQALHDPELIRPTIVMDAGIATEENLRWLREQHYTYIVCARQNPPAHALETELVPVNESDKYLVKAARIRVEDQEEQWLYCESQAKAEKAQQMIETFQSRFERDLRKIADSLTKPKGRKTCRKVAERIGRLKEKHRRVAHCYKISLQTDPEKKHAIKMTWSRKQEKIEAKINGSYCLRTNLKNQDVSQLWNLYGMLLKIEDAFRFMKSELGMRPLYHQKAYRMDGHLWITLLAYHLIQNCLYQLKQAGINCRWKTIRNILSSRIRVTLNMRTEDKSMIYHRSTTKPEGQHMQIYAALGLSPRIGRSKKCII